MSKLRALIKREPAMVLGVICGAATWALTRYLGYTPDAAQQVVYGFVPFVFGAITRQFVTPAASATDDTVDALDTFMAALHHPAIFGSIVARLRKELPAILAEATQATVTVTPGLAVTTAEVAPATDLPPLIPPDVPQETPAVVETEPVVTA